MAVIDGSDKSINSIEFIWVVLFKARRGNKTKNRKKCLIKKGQNLQKQ